MKYSIETDIDCSACRDDVLMPLLAEVNNVFFQEKEGGVHLLIDSDKTIEEIKDFIEESSMVSIELSGDKLLSDADYESLKADFTQYHG